MSADQIRKTLLGPQCWACRERRVRCGSETPSCAKCEAKGLQCPGYSPTRPLRWREPKNPTCFRRGNGANYIKCISIDSSRSPGPSRWTPAVFSLEAEVANEIVYFNERIAPDCVPIDSPSNPFRCPLRVTTVAPVYINHVYAAISTFHRIVQRRYSYPYKTQTGSNAVTIRSNTASDPEEQAFYRYYASALGGLNSELSTKTAGINFTVLGGIMMLLYSQLQQASTGQWRVHLTGFKRVIDHYGGWESLLTQRLGAGFLLANMLIIDAISTTTSPVSALDRQDTIRWHRAYLHVLPHLDYQVIPSPTPIPPELLRVIIMVNLVRAATDRSALDNDAECNYTLSQILAELGITALADGTGIDATGCISQLALHKPERTLSNNSTNYSNSHNYALFTTCYRSAIAIYAVEVYTSLETPTIDQILDPALLPAAASAIRTNAYTTLITSLRTLLALKDTKSERQLRQKSKPRKSIDERATKEGTEGEEGEYWKFIFWPLAIAGVQAVLARNETDYVYICDRLFEMTADLGTLCMRDAALLMQRLWREASILPGTSILDRSGSGLGAARAMSWDEVFRDAPLFLL
ncbi:Zn(II)2Cys6 transcription factor [Aspergillus lucknowensis]|uniref:Fungal-specific transcription factor domain-containing protein n=1 Tax=Aspergillus lucknowensis TaxID=176173 RepID=A0ABR4M1Z4_9EURO